LIGEIKTHIKGGREGGGAGKGGEKRRKRGGKEGMERRGGDGKEEVTVKGRGLERGGWCPPHMTCLHDTPE